MGEIIVLPQREKKYNETEYMSDTCLSMNKQVLFFF